MKLLGLILLTASAGWGQVPVPVQVQAMNDLPNAAQLNLVYCSSGNKVCVTRRAICYGQCGTQDEADEMGYGCSGDVEGRVPAGFHYARWVAFDYETGKITGGLATKGYSTKGCMNRR